MSFCPPSSPFGDPQLRVDAHAPEWPRPRRHSNRIPQASGVQIALIRRCEQAMNDSVERMHTRLSDRKRCGSRELDLITQETEGEIELAFASAFQALKSLDGHPLYIGGFRDVIEATYARCKQEITGARRGLSCPGANGGSSPVDPVLSGAFA